MPGTKRKIPIQKRETKEQRAVAFCKRRKGLFKKAAELCLLSDAHVAVLAFPPSDKPSAAVHSFGHCSVNDVIDTFLHSRRPNPTSGNASPSVPRDPRSKMCDCLRPKKSGLGFWWETEGFEKREDPDELRDYIERLKKLKENVTIHLKNRDKQIVSLGSNSALTVHETEMNGGSDKTFWETRNEKLVNDDFCNGLRLDDLEIPDFAVETKEDNPRIKETEINGSTNQNFWETKNDDLGNDGFDYWLWLDDLKSPDSSVKYEEDYLIDTIETWCKQNNITTDESVSDEHRHGFSYSELLGNDAEVKALPSATDD